MNKQARILIVGHDELIEQALTRSLKEQGHRNILSAKAMKLDVLDQEKVRKVFADEKPEYVFLSSARSGGIDANQKLCAEFIYANLESQNNVIHCAFRGGTRKLLFIASSCVYPKESPQPIKEEYLLTAALEPTSEPYAVAKIAGIKMCEAYTKQYGFKAVALVPATLYGPAADTDSATAHVLGALMGKFQEARRKSEPRVTLWGSGKPKREFLFADDLADACIFLMKNYDGGLINVGTGEDIAIKDLAQMIARITGFQGKIDFDASKPDGAMRKLLDSSRIRKLGWKPKVGLEEGIKRSFGS